MTEATYVAEIERLKSTMIMRSFFVMFRTIVEPAKAKNAVLEHYRWIIGLEKEGLVFASGPLFADESAPGVGMTVFRVGNREAAAQLAAADPFVASGAATFEIKRWQLNEGRISLSIDFSDQTYRFD
jgi:uncharacterized protein YciI